MVPSPVIAQALHTVGSLITVRDEPGCALCRRRQRDHAADCLVRLAENFPGDLDRARLALTTAAAAGDDGAGPACVKCHALSGLPHRRDCAVYFGLFTIECLDAQAA